MNELSQERVREQDPATPTQARSVTMDDAIGAANDPQPASQRGLARDDEPARQREAVLREQLLAQLAKRYRVAGNKYHLVGGDHELAFEDRGRKLVTERDDPDTARAMVRLALAKGWHSVSLRGTQAFKREAWIEASLQGVAVKGYRPQELDRVRLDELRAERERAPRERAGSSLAPKRPGLRETPEPSLSAPKQRALVAMQVLMQSRGYSQAVIERGLQMAREQMQRDNTYVGRVLDTGVAPYKGDPQQGQSAFVRLQTAHGEQTLWGLDLTRALQVESVAVGDHVALRVTGREPVQVSVSRTDAAGNRVGTRTLQTHRNGWQAINLERVPPTQQRALDAAAQRTRKEPRVRVVDRDAPPAPRRAPRIEPVRTSDRQRG